MRGLDYMATVGPVRVHGVTLGYGLDDYSFGENQILALNQFFNAIGRPVEFEARMEGLWAAYEKLRTSFATLAATTRAEGMKQLGAQAAALQEEIIAAQKSKQAAGDKRAQGIAAPAPGRVGPPPAVYNPTEKSGPLGLPVWAWWAGGAAVAVIALGPIVAPLIAARAVRR